MGIHPNVSPIEITGVSLYLIRGQKTALIDTGPKKPFPPPPGMIKNEGISGAGPDMVRDLNSPDSDQPSNDTIVPVITFSKPILNKLGMTLSDIDYILNSHVHFDHTAGNAAVKEASGAKILIHTADSGYFENPRRIFDRELAPIIEEMKGKEQLEVEFKRFMEEITGPGPYVPIDGKLEDNDVIELGDGCNLRVIHLPGHTAGSAGFYWEEEQILFAGDALNGVSGHLGGLPIIDDPVAYQQTLQRVQQLPITTLFNAHPFRSYTVPNKTILKGEEIKTYLSECDQFAQSLREAAKRVAPDFQKKPFAEIYDAAIGLLPTSANLKKSAEMPERFFSAGTLLNCIQQLI
jgi:glyoxylase-like metal-dependent hydrolase (beta-lactamase superfamily II)